jgi:ADP-ribosylglycohydrolase
MLPEDYVERVYAGVLGKIIGVYLGRPFEGWSYDVIAEKLGDIDYYVHDKVGVPLLVTDDDISGTFTFLRALADNGNSMDITPAQIGEAWLNYIVESRAILWWGGFGNSTEHTAFLRLKRGIEAPRSGSIGLNGQVVAEQIGAQIFIDGWALVAPGRPELAAELACRAGSVSHDGESVLAAQVLAAMEAQAFVTADIDELLDIGLSFIPADSVIATMIGDIRSWHSREPDWRAARTLLEEKYGYHIYGGNCHVVPNHGLIVLALLYGGGDWDRSMMIVNTCGWDTDCNSGNLGALLGIRGGIGIFDSKNWRGPVADRLYLPTADGGRAITDAVAETYHIVNSGRALAGLQPIERRRFDFSLPGSVQGFTGNVGNTDGRLRIDGGIATTPTFTPPDAFDMPGYRMLASPTLYSGQKLRASVDGSAHFVVQHYGPGDELLTIDGPPADAEWTIPDTGGQPIAAVGLAVDGTAYLDWLDWSGEPTVTLTRTDGSMWAAAWVDSADQFVHNAQEPYRIIQNAGRGLILHGTREWRNYRVTATMTPHLATEVGVAARVQGLRRYYAVLLGPDGARLTKVHSGTETTLAEAQVGWQLGREYAISLEVRGNRLTATVDGTTLSAEDAALENGGIGLICTEGRVGVDTVTVAPA